jgi:hypothetical protein
MKTTLQATCPHCQAAIEYPVAQSGQFRTCEECRGALRLPPAPTAPEPPPQSAAAEVPWYAKNPPPAMPEAQRIRKTAERFVNAAQMVFTFCIGIAVLVGFLAMSGTLQIGGAFAVGFGIFASFASLAGWLYLVAQVVHIRANTTPDKL